MRVSPWRGLVAVGLCGSLHASSRQQPGSAEQHSGCSAAGRLLLGVVHCRREQGRRSQAGGEQERGLEWVDVQIQHWRGESLLLPAFKSVFI